MDGVKLIKTKEVKLIELKAESHDNEIVFILDVFYSGKHIRKASKHCDLVLKELKDFLDETV